MTQPTESKGPPRLAGIESALRRAAIKALELGQHTNTPVWVVEQGRLIDLNQPSPKTS